MIRSLGSLIGYSVRSLDDHQYRLYDVLFDDRRWVVRHLVVGSHDWLMGRKILISPRSIKEIDPARRVVIVRKSVQELEESPDIESDCPVSRQKDLEFKEQYGWLASMYGVGFQAIPFAPRLFSTPQDGTISTMLEQADPHCRSLRVVGGYSVADEHHRIGAVETVMADDRTWKVHSLLVRLHGIRRTPGMLFPVHQVRGVSWENRCVFVSRRTASTGGGHRHLQSGGKRRSATARSARG
jgi:hypothetical protein